MKKLITLFILLQACCMNIWAYSFEHNNIYYNITSGINKEVEVTFKDLNSNDTYTGNITIPETVANDTATFKVTGIGYKAFYYQQNIEKVSLPATITKIDSYAFCHCSKITSITTRGSSNIEQVKEFAFSDCTSLQSVPDFSKVKIINRYIFQNCSALEKVTFSSNVTAIKVYAFRQCKSLKTAGNFSNVTSVETRAFQDCENLEFSVNDFSKITRLGIEAFYNCKKLERINLSNVSHFEKAGNASGFSAFSGCTNLKTVTYPAQITTIPSSIFSGCINLETVVFTNDNITSIENSAFSNCHKLTTFPNISKVETIGSGAFNQCYSLQIERLTIPDVTTSIGMMAFMGCPGIRHLSLGNGITSIPQRAFANQTGKGAEIASEDYKLESITFGNNLKTIVDEAFISCVNLKEIVTPASLERIGTNAFLNCKNLALADLSNSTKLTVIEKKVFSGCSSFFHIDYPQKTDNSSKNKLNKEFGNKNILILPSSIETIEDYAFSNCTNLEDVSLSSSVKEIGSNAFQGCNNLTSFTLESSNMNEIKDYAFDGCSGLTSVKIPSNITRIGKYAFRNCSGLTALNIPNSVKTIDKEAFKDCKGLTSINIPARIATLGESAFYGCEGLTAVHIPNIETWCNLSFESSYDNPLYYAKHLFLNGEEVKDLVIPSSVKSINKYLFYGCEGLKSVSMPESITTIGDYAFRNCSGLTSVHMPNSLTTIGDYAFQSCSGLTSVHMPDSLTTIGDYAFSGCWWLNSIKISQKVTSIGVGAFSYCYNLESIYSFPKIPVACDESIFISNTYNNATLYVPAGSETAYKATSPWNKFNINSIPTSIKDVTSENNIPEKVDIFTIDGKLFKKDFNFKDAANELPTNTYIINGKKYLVK